MARRPRRFSIDRNPYLKRDRSGWYSPTTVGMSDRTRKLLGTGWLLFVLGLGIYAFAQGAADPTLPFGRLAIFTVLAFVGIFVPLGLIRVMDPTDGGKWGPIPVLKVTVLIVTVGLSFLHAPGVLLVLLIGSAVALVLRLILSRRR